MTTRDWTVAEAKARFSELIEQARSKGPQIITRHGRTAAVVVSAEEWGQKTKRTGNLAEFFAASPLRDSGLKIRRRKDHPRRLDLRASCSTPTSSRNGSGRGLISASSTGSPGSTRTACS